MDGVDGVYQSASLLNVAQYTDDTPNFNGNKRAADSKIRLADLELQYPNWTAKILY